MAHDESVHCGHVTGMDLLPGPAEGLIWSSFPEDAGNVGNRPNGVFGVLHGAPGTFRRRLQEGVELPEDRLLAVAAELADALAGDFDATESAAVLAARAAEILGAATAVLLLDGPDGKPRLAADSGARTRAVETDQLANGWGPAFDALRAHVIVQCADLLAPGCRWPSFAETAARQGFRSVDVLLLQVRERVIGTLSLMRDEPGGLSPAELALASALARMAAIGLYQQHRVREREIRGRTLQAELDRNVVTEQAVGVLSSRWRARIPFAREHLRAIAHAHEQELHDAAAVVVRSASRSGE